MADCLVSRLRCSGDARAELHPLGAGRPSLLVVRADVLDGHEAAEAERAIHGEMRAALEKGFSDAEVARALHRLEIKRASALADASGLASALIDAFAATGSWRDALGQAPAGARQDGARDVAQDGDGGPAKAASAFLPERAFTLTAERDPIRSPKNQEYARLVSLLSLLHARNGGGADRREGAVREAVRQFGLMSAEMRRGALLLLEAEAAR
jgi:hypothetical protein